MSCPLENSKGSGKTASNIKDIIDKPDSEKPNIGPEQRYIVIHNLTNSVIYPGLYAKESGGGELLMDKQPGNYEKDIPSGFKLEPNEYRYLIVPRYLDSGRVWARTGCQFSEHGYDNKECSLVCETGNCPMNKDEYNKSDQGVRCGIIGGEPPVTAIEFSFARNVDFYDISQVDGNNIGASMKPLGTRGVDYAEEPPQTPGDTTLKSKSGMSIPSDNPLWCSEASCNPVQGEEGCPRELRVYSKDATSNKFLTCQSICHAVSQFGNTEDIEKTDDIGYVSEDHKMYAKNSEALKANDREMYNTLWDAASSYMRWDDDAENTGMYKLDDVAFDPKNLLPEQREKKREYSLEKGRWVPDTNNTCTSPNENCLMTKQLYCCAANENNDCGDIDAATRVEPSLSGSDQGCSPYVLSARTNKHQKHVCWSETWPDIKSPGNLREWCQGKMSKEECSYSNVFKKQCSKAYSWQFDDLNSTYTCSSADENRNAEGGHKLPNYYISFFEKSETWDNIKNRPTPTPSPNPSPTPSPSLEKDTDTNLFIWIAIGVLTLFLALYFIH